jgi:hypothetical protein
MQISKDRGGFDREIVPVTNLRIRRKRLQLAPASAIAPQRAGAVIGERNEALDLELF